MHFFVVAFLFAFLISHQVNANPEFESYKRKLAEAQTRYTDEQLARFNRYKQVVREGLSAYKQRVKKRWGFAEVSTDHKYVVYSEDLTEKLIIDYRNNSISLQRLEGSRSEDARELIEQTLSQQAIPSLRQSLAATLGLSTQQISVVADQLLSDQFQVASEKRLQANIGDLEALKNKLEHKNLDATQTSRADQDFQATIASELQATKSILKQVNDLPTNVTTEVNVKKDPLGKAMLYRKYVNTQSKKYGLPSSLIYGVMEVESEFNPRAQSPVPAFGLMQIVPMAAGVDANAFLNRGNNAPTRAELFQPNNNVLLGSTYLYILYNQYFKNVDDENSRLYCALAAYNTGMGNVASLFTPDGSKVMRPAIERINALSSNEVYQQIVNHAHPETQQYLVKVLNAKKRYDGL